MLQRISGLPLGNQRGIVEIIDEITDALRTSSGH